MTIRQPVAFGFYPEDKEDLSKMVDKLLSSAKKQDICVKGLLVPHAGYVYSGTVAAQGFKQLHDDKNSRKVVYIIAANHHPQAMYRGLSIPKYDKYKTPLGNVSVSGKTKEFTDVSTYNEYAHQTHVIEVELPFLQKVLNNFEIIPMITSSLMHDDQDKIANIIEKDLDDETIILISADLSHFHPYDEAVKLDKQVIDTILSLDTNRIDNTEIDGPDAAGIVMRIAKKKKWKSKLLMYKNSGDVTGDKSSVVGYATIVFYE